MRLRVCSATRSQALRPQTFPRFCQRLLGLVGHTLLLPQSIHPNAHCSAPHALVGHYPTDPCIFFTSQLLTAIFAAHQPALSVSSQLPPAYLQRFCPFSAYPCKTHHVCEQSAASFVTRSVSLANIFTTSLSRVMVNASLARVFALSCFHTVVVSSSPAVNLAVCQTLMRSLLSCAQALMLSCAHAILMACSTTLLLSFGHAQRTREFTRSHVHSLAPP